MKKKTIRQLKKQNDMARCILFADKTGTIKRGVWSAYFHKYPSDYKKVRKLLKKTNFYHYLVDDYKSFYQHPDIKKEEVDKIVKQMRSVCALPYLRFKKLGHLYSCSVGIDDFIQWGKCLC